jgi:hypothetical protein
VPHAAFEFGFEYRAFVIAVAYHADVRNECMCYTIIFRQRAIIIILLTSFTLRFLPRPTCSDFGTMFLW